MLVVLDSSRSQGNTRILADAAAAFTKACRTLVDLRARSFSDYDYAHANRDDDFAELADALLTRNCIVLATPVHWYSMSATMKTLRRLPFRPREDLKTARPHAGRTAAICCGDKHGC